MCAEAERDEDAEHDGEGKFGADVEEHEGIEDVDDEEGEAPGEDGVGAAHEDVRGKIDGGHAGGADGAGGHADEVGVGPEEGDEEEAGEADGDGATGEDGEEELGDDHDVQAGDGEDVHGAGADEGVADGGGEGGALAEEDGAIEVGDARGMFEANAHAAREVVADGIESAAEGMCGGGGDAVRGRVVAFDPEFAGARFGGVGGGAEPASALPGFAEAGRGVGGGDGGDDVEGDVGVGGEEGGPACGGVVFAAEGGVCFDAEGGGVRGVAGLVGDGAQGGDARGHDGCGEREA